MNKLSIWYSNLSPERRKQITAGGIIIGVIALAIIGLVLLVPKKVEVTYGKIVWDPDANYIWEEESDYKTITVSANEADKYKLEYEVKYTPETQQKKDEEAAQQAAADAQAAQHQGLENATLVLTEQQVKDIKTLQSNLETVGPQVVRGFEMTNAIKSSRNSLVTYRDQLINTPVPAEVEGLKQQAVDIFNKLIRSCDLYISAVANVDMSAFNQANALINEAFTQMMQLVPQWTQ